MSDPPRAPLRVIPDGFVYSEEAKRDLRRRGQEAQKRLREAAKNPKLAERIERLVRRALED